jgi:WD40 repeat protein
VGDNGITQLWDTESYKPLGLPIGQQNGRQLYCVSFSRDGRYLAYGGDCNEMTLWKVKDIAPELQVRTRFHNL